MAEEQAGAAMEVETVERSRRESEDVRCMDISGMTFVSSPLSADSYLQWSRVVKLLLELR
ncbi:UNVERIFIED_CONTAM: hypothetical protein Sradi_5071500 [Sesamum radiatum]|uniref:Retrotransposon Copia-like N-terminal domain-containing protein n=1 Tax=Sesamum radiatum TaxID=300843 RepID=A0AAW2M0B9_SESRA